MIITHPSVQANSVKDLIALAKAKPGQLNYGSVSGSASHLSTELFKIMSGVNIVHIPYKGAAPATTDVVAGQIQLSFASTPGSVPVVKSGKVKALAVTSAKRIAKLPDVPTVSEAALPGYEASVWYGVVAPSRTPRPIVQRLNKEIATIVAEPVHRDRMLAGDFEPTSGTPEQFAAFIKSETVKQKSNLQNSLPLITARNRDRNARSLCVGGQPDDAADISFTAKNTTSSSCVAMV